MYAIGTKIVVIKLPRDNEMWGLPDKVVGQSGTIVDLNDTYYRVEMENGRILNFPLFGVLRPKNFNRWNPMGYIPRTEPLKLP